MRSAIVIPVAPVHPTSQQLLAWFPTYLTATVTVSIFSGIVSWIANSITTGITIKFTSDLLEKGQANLQTSFNFTLTKILSLLAASIITGILIVLGLIALVIPGIILAIMFSLVYPAIMLEGTGVSESVSRSRVLVSNRWLKTFGLLLVTWHYCRHSKWRNRIYHCPTWRSQPSYFRHSDSFHNTNLCNSHNTVLLLDESKNSASTATTNLLKNNFRSDPLSILKMLGAIFFPELKGHKKRVISSKLSGFEPTQPQQSGLWMRLII